MSLHVLDHCAILWCLLLVGLYFVWKVWRSLCCWGAMLISCKWRSMNKKSICPRQSSLQRVISKFQIDCSESNCIWNMETLDLRMEFGLSSLLWWNIFILRVFLLIFICLILVTIFVWHAVFNDSNVLVSYFLVFLYFAIAGFCIAPEFYWAIIIYPVYFLWVFFKVVSL